MVPEELLGDSCERGENLSHGDSSEAREGSDIEGPAAARIGMSEKQTGVR